MAPESMSSLEYSEKSDVWSYGIVLSEIIYRHVSNIKEISKKNLRVGTLS